MRGHIIIIIIIFIARSQGAVAVQSEAPVGCIAVSLLACLDAIAELPSAELEVTEIRLRVRARGSAEVSGGVCLSTYVAAYY